MKINFQVLKIKKWSVIDLFFLVNNVGQHSLDHLGKKKKEKYWGTRKIPNKRFLYFSEVPDLFSTFFFLFFLVFCVVDVFVDLPGSSFVVTSKYIYRYTHVYTVGKFCVPLFRFRAHISLEIRHVVSYSKVCIYTNT